MKDLQAGLRQRRANSLYRRRRIAETPQQPVMRVDGREVVNFCGNDYLGLANHPRVVQAFREATNEFGVGAGAAHLINGHTRHHHALEEALAEFTGRERALLFSTGYMANIGVCQALVGRGDAIFADRLSHASLLDGARLSNARLHRYAHASPRALSRKLETSPPSAEKLIMTDGVFSMDGDLAPLPELAAIAKAHQAWLLVDDAHGLGVLGRHGGGGLAKFGLDASDVPILMGTLGKAFGTAGAFIAGSETLVEHLIQSARAYIFTTAMPAALAAATLTSLNIVRNQPGLRARLRDHTHYFRHRASTLDYPLLPSETPIQGILAGDNETAIKLSETLFQAGILVTAIRPPTVPEGTTRLRITLSASHTRQQIDQLLQALEIL